MALRRIQATKRLTDRERLSRVFRPTASGATVVSCASCGIETDVTRGLDGRIETVERINVETPTDYAYEPDPDPGVLRERTEKRLLPRNVRGWICPDCQSTFGAVAVETYQPKPKIWRIGPSILHNTPVQRKAAQKLQDYLDYCDVAGISPNPDMVWAITAILKAKRSYGFTRVTEMLRSSAGWAHTGKPWPSWNVPLVPGAKPIDVLDSRTTRAKQGKTTAYRPDDYTVTLSSIIDAALQDARRIHWQPLRPTIIDRRKYPPYESGVTWACHSLQGQPFTDHPFNVQSLVSELPAIIDSAVQDARIPRRYRPTFGESSNLPRSNAVVMEYRIGETPAYVPTIGQRIACKHGLLPVTCAMCGK